MVTGDKTRSGPGAAGRPAGAGMSSGLLPRTVILRAAKTIFSSKGVEAATLADVAKAARVPEDHLREAFGTKHRLLLALLDEGWGAINPNIAEIIATSPDARRAMTSILSTAAHVMQKDPELVRLMLLEAYRPDPATNRVTISRGYQTFIDMTTKVAELGQQQGHFKTSYQPRVIVSLVVAVGQGVLRDALLAQEQGGPNPYTTPQIMAAFEAIVSSLKP